MVRGESRGAGDAYQLRISPGGQRVSGENTGFSLVNTGHVT